MVYILLLYQDLILLGHSTRQTKLPCVLPIVLCRGKRPWRAPRSLEELIEEPFSGCEPCVPAFSFVTIRAQHEPKALLRELDSMGDAKLKNYRRKVQEETEQRVKEEKVQMARAMRAEKIDTAVILKVTGVSAEEIEG